MIFKETTLHNAFLVEIEKRADVRGFFARSWCRHEFQAMGLCVDFVQSNISFTRQAGTIRGLHYQLSPYEEVKLVRCTRGAIYDVILDLRPRSATYKQWFGVELTADNYEMLVVPEGFGHGYQTLENDCEVSYQVSQVFNPEAERGIRWNDGAFNIAWPIDPPSLVSDKDKNWPDYPGTT